MIENQNRRTLRMTSSCSLMPGLNKHKHVQSGRKTAVRGTRQTKKDLCSPQAV